MKQYVLSVDQSTQGTKALIFDSEGRMLARADLSHRQIVNEHGWVEHDPEEIWRNVLQAVRQVTEKAGVSKQDIAVLGISNQRETTVRWDRKTGKPFCNAIVWQCARGAAICDDLQKQGMEETVQRATGIRLSPYFPAAKLAWIFSNIPGIREKAKRGDVCAGTVDSWLIFRLTHGQRHQTDYSNASRTQLFHIHNLTWDPELLKIFQIDASCLPVVTDSDGDYGDTDFDGWLDKPIPIRGVLGDSHAALFGQGCLTPGMIKATYGTGSSIMMNVGETPVFSDAGVVTSLAWKIGGRVSYVLEGNIIYAGAVITWLKDDLKLITHAGETEDLANAANPLDTTYQLHPLTVFWRSGDGIGTIRLLRSLPDGRMIHLHTVLFNGVLDHTRIHMQVDNLTGQDVDIFYEIACAGIPEDRILPDRWDLPGLTVHLSADAPAPVVRRMDHRTVRVVYPSRIASPDSLHLHFQLDPEQKE